MRRVYPRPPETGAGDTGSVIGSVPHDASTEAPAKARIPRTNGRGLRVMVVSLVKVVS